MSDASTDPAHPANVYRLDGRIDLEAFHHAYGRPPTGDELHRAMQTTNGSTPADGDRAEPPHPAGADGEDTSQGGKPSQATVLTEIAEAHADLWHEPDGTAFATVPVGDHVEHHPVRTRPFRTWLRRRYWDLNGKAPGSQGVQDAVETIDGQALFAGEQRPVHVRVAEHDGAIYLDLADECWRVVEITAAGWRIIGPADAPVRFRRRPAMCPLPTPETGGRLSELRHYINVADDDWPLVVAWLVAAIRPSGPYPVLNVTGEHGSAKSTLCRMLRRLVDPNTAELRRLTRDERDLVIAATNSAVVAFENVSGLQPWQSDALAALATGTGFATRTLYENADETIFAACRPIMLNGIAGLAERADLLDRSIILDLPKLDESDTDPEEFLMPAFEAARPRLLGALLDAVVAGLEHLPDVTLDRYPRMADFARWAVACEPAFDVEEGAFLAAYRANRANAQETAKEADPVATIIQRHVTEHGELHGTAAELLAAVTPGDDRRQLPKDWPKSGRGMGAALKRAAPTLRAAGITVEPPAAHARPRRWRLGRGATDATDGPTEQASDLQKQAVGSPDGCDETDDQPTGQPTGSKPLPQTGSVDPVVFDDPASTQSNEGPCPRCGTPRFTAGPPETLCADCYTHDERKTP